MLKNKPKHCNIQKSFKKILQSKSCMKPKNLAMQIPHKSLPAKQCIESLLYTLPAKKTKKWQIHNRTIFMLQNSLYFFGRHSKNHITMTSCHKKFIPVGELILGSISSNALFRFCIIQSVLQVSTVLKKHALYI